MHRSHKEQWRYKKRCSVDSIKFSIIIPVYNVKEYLKRCVDSVVKQTYSDIDILLIDDGSTDGSGEECERLAQKDVRIRVIHQKNEGLSAARNTGLQNAHGEYIIFLDSDDYISPDCCERFMEVISNDTYDIVAADAYIVKGTQIKHQTVDRSHIAVPTDGRTFLSDCLKSGYTSMCAPFALYRRAFVVDNELWFIPGLLHEDQLWTPQVFLKAQKVTYIRHLFYYHWIREDSIGNSSWSTRRYNDIQTVCKKLYPIYAEQGECSPVFLDNLCMLYMDAVNRSKDRKADKAFMKKTAFGRINRMKRHLYSFSPCVYFAVNRLMKRLKSR